MAVSRWWFVIDGDNETRALTKEQVERLHAEDFAIPSDVPLRDQHGVLVAEVEVKFAKRVPTSVERIHLYVIPARESSLGLRTASVYRGVVPAVRMALRRKLHERSALVQSSAEDACNGLEWRIKEGKVDDVYRTRFGRLELASRSLEGW